ncbi:MAG: HAMP domain-containing histidine kinase, partial [Planctomycetales bacterium]|nr:HAMP domain-containing histidine kinase [Planctomycetales bacterium]
SSAELALAKPRTADEYRKHLEKCERAAQRMRQLVDSLLLLARLDAGAAKTDWAVCQLDRIVNECVELLRPLVAEQSLELDIHVAACQVMGNAVLLGQVVTNLLTNAVHYNRPGGQVVIRLEPTSDAVQLTIQDSGIGIPEDQIPSLFDRFFRVDKARSRQVGGSGLGLAICRRILDAHHAHVEVTSQIDAGTQVVVTFPRVGPLHSA